MSNDNLSNLSTNNDICIFVNISDNEETFIVGRKKKVKDAINTNNYSLDNFYLIRNTPIGYLLNSVFSAYEPDDRSEENLFKVLTHYSDCYDKFQYKIDDYICNTTNPIKLLQWMQIKETYELYRNNELSSKLIDI